MRLNRAILPQPGSLSVRFATLEQRSLMLSGCPMDKDYLILKRASANRPSGDWNDDDYDVLANGEVVGRIFKAAASPVGTPWSGRSHSGTTRIERQRTAMPQAGIALPFGHYEDRTRCIDGAEHTPRQSPRVGAARTIMPD
jgi:hypothetical protein